MSVAERPTAYPFNMHAAVHALPEAFSAALERNAAALDAFAAEAAESERLFLVGIGTSYHAVQLGEFFMRACGGGLPAFAWHSFDFVLYGPQLTARDAVVVVSHTARKSYSVEAIKKVGGTDAKLALLAGLDAVKHDAPDFLFEASPAELSATYTISYTGALGVLADLARRIGERRGAAATLSSASLTETTPAALWAGLAFEDRAQAFADAHAGHRRIWLTGGGPSAITAQEVALKIKEAAYIQAEGMSIEQMFHGPFQCADVNDLFVLIAPAGPAQTRTLQLAGPIREIGAQFLLIGDGTGDPAARALALETWDVPAVPEPLTALSCLVPLHLFAYYLALARGTNPDRFHLDDERFAKAYALNTL